MRYMKQVVKSRHGFAAAHVMYLRSLRNIGAALLQFATAENSLHHHHPRHHMLAPSPTPPPPPPPPPPRSNPRPNPPMSPTSWTTTTSTATSSAVHPPPPPPPQAGNSAWDFWDPFMPTAGRSVDEEEWEEDETTSVSETAVTTTAGTQSVAPPSVITATSTSNTTAAEGSSELAVVVSGKGKDLLEIIKELDDYFLQAANAGGPLSALLEVPTTNFNGQAPTGKDYGQAKSLNPLMWTWGSSSAKFNTFGKFCEDPIGNKLSALGSGNGNFNHCSTVERLCTWEKKLYQEVKNAEYLKFEHEKKAATLRKLELNNADYIKTEKAKKESEKLESQMLVASQAIETISAEIIKLRDSVLYPQLLELVNGLANMWRSMYQFHQVQTHIVQQLKYLNSIPSTEPTSEIHRQSTLQLELEAQQWHISFCNLMKSHRDYVQSLTGWLRLSLFEVGNNPLQKTHSPNASTSAIYTLCEEWQHAINNAPDKVASEGIKSFLSMIHTIVVQQSDEQKQKKRSEAAFRDLEKKAGELRSLENKHGPYSTLDSSNSNPVREKRAKVDLLRAKAQDEQAKHEKAVGVTRAMTINNLQMGLPHIFQALTGFANVSKQAIELMHNRDKTGDVKMLMP